MLFTSLVCGALTEPLLRRMGMRAADIQAAEAAASAASPPSPVLDVDHSMPPSAASSAAADREPPSGFAAWWRRIDDQYVKTWFGGRSPADLAGHGTRRLSLNELGADDYTELGAMHSAAAPTAHASNADSDDDEKSGH